MSATFTPGPWKASKLNLNHGVYAANGECICKVDGSSIAEIDRRCAATARLIAAAPALLEAIEEALEFVADQEDVIDGSDGRPEANRAMSLAITLRAAIAAARGQA